MSKKILILTPFPPNGIGGAETFVKGLIQEASKCHEVSLCTLKPLKNTWRGVSFGNLFSVLPRLSVLAFVSCLRKKPDIIHAQGLIAAWIAIHLKSWLGLDCKIYTTLLALYQFDKWGETFAKKYVRMIFEYSDLIFVEGERGKEDVHSVFVGNPYRSAIDKRMWLGVEPSIRKFTHWVDQDLFKPIFVDKLGKVKVLFVGRPIKEKGRHVIEGAQRILEMSGREYFEFIYVDNVSHADLVGYYQSSSILVVPSLYQEGHTRTIAEAASCGCAVLASNRGSLPEQVKDFGWICEPTPSEFASKLNDMHCIRSAMGRDAAKYAKENFSSKNAEVFLNAYRNL